MAKKRVKKSSRSSNARILKSKVASKSSLSTNQEVEDLLSKKFFVTKMFFYLIFLAVFVYGFYYAVVFDTFDGIYIICASIVLFLLYKLIHIIFSKIKKK